MLKVHLKLRASRDIEKTGWKKGDVLEMINNIFDTQCGIAYFPLDKGWEILKMEVVKHEKIDIQ